MMPAYTTEYFWGAHRQERGRWTKRFNVYPGSQVYIWLFGWVFYYTSRDSKYPPETEPKFQPWRDLASLVKSKLSPKQKPKPTSLWDEPQESRWRTQ